MTFDVVAFAFTLLWENLSRSSCMRSRQPQVFWRPCYSPLARSLVLRSSPRIFEQKRDCLLPAPKHNKKIIICSFSIPFGSYGPNIAGVSPKWIDLEDLRLSVIYLDFVSGTLLPLTFYEGWRTWTYLTSTMTYFTKSQYFSRDKKYY